MKPSDADAAMQQAVHELLSLRRELPAAIHASAAGVHAHEVEGIVRPNGEVVATPNDIWADRRSKAEDLEDLPSLDEPIANLAATIDALRAALPKP
jgi:hypothetical protein